LIVGLLRNLKTRLSDKHKIRSSGAPILVLMVSVGCHLNKTIVIKFYVYFCDFKSMKYPLWYEHQEKIFKFCIYEMNTCFFTGVTASRQM